MEQEPATPDEDLRQAHSVERARAYLRAGGAAERTAAFEHLARDLASADRQVAQARLRAWVFDDLPPALTTSGDYARYRDLLPQVLAGTLAPADPAYTWFLGYLEECDPCFEEYAELQAALDAEAAEAATPARLVAEAAAPGPGWGLLLRAQASYRLAAGAAEMRVAFGAPAGLPPGASTPPGAQEATEWQTFVSQVGGLPPAAGGGRLVTLVVEARQEDESTVHLYIALGGSGLPAPPAGIPVRVQLPGAPAIELNTDAQGTANVRVPLAALPAVTLTVHLPPSAAPGSAPATRPGS